MVYGEWLSLWLETYVRPSVKQRTYTHYQEIVKQHIAPQLGGAALSEITPRVLQCHIAKLLKSGNSKTGEGLAQSSVNSIITVIQSSLKTAYALGIVRQYTADKIKRPRESERRVECFSVSEQKKIEQYILHKDGTRLFGVLLCLYTGLRIGELMALEWSDIDTGKGLLRVTRSCHYGKDENGIYGRITGLPKTKSSVRTVPIPKQLMPHLRAAKKESRSEYIVANGSRPVSIRAYQRSFAAMLKNLEIRHRGFHSLRHTFATRALECGMDVKALSEILGHKSPTVTLNRYAHAFMEHKKEMMNKLGRLL